MRTIEWNPDGPTVRMIDQRRLPAELVWIDLASADDLAQAIKDMAVRGAPAIGAAAAYGLALAAARAAAADAAELWEAVLAAADTLRRARPTAVNLGWAIDRCLKAAEEAADGGSLSLREALLDTAQRIADEDVAVNQAIGRHGAALLPPNALVIHHCNTGALATVDWGTALGVIRTAHQNGQGIRVLVDETRPRLQGAKLTAWELQQYGVPFEIIADNAAGYFLSHGEVSAVLVGADRVAANGDVANKIGTYMLALAAHDNDVPFYVALPTSTIDLNLPSGRHIPIEERDPAEVLDLSQHGRPIAPKGSRARNPAFDVTPHRLVTAFITEVGVIEPPFAGGLVQAVQRAKAG